MLSLCLVTLVKKDSLYHKMETVPFDLHQQLHFEFVYCSR